MTTTSTDQHPGDRLPVVEEVVATLTSAAGAGYGGAAALRAGMRRATDQFDEHAAAALARSLVDNLCKAPDDVRILETLVILGLAHPGALARHRISLAHEGKRLAFLLEKAGQFERAYCLGELISERSPAEIVEASPEDAEAVEQLVRDAESARARGRLGEAIRCLEDALRLDPSRTDLPRALRDLRRKKENREAGAQHFVKVGSILVLVTAVLGFVVQRELRIWSAWKALPEASREDAPAMRARLAGIDALLSKESVWLTMPAALLDRDLLRHNIELVARPMAPVDTNRSLPEPVSPDAAQAEKAEAMRASGLKNAEMGHVGEAIADLKQALELAPPDWAHAARVRADVAALEAWQKKSQ